MRITPGEEVKTLLNTTKIRTLMATNGIPQQSDLAKRMGAKESNVSLWLNNKRKITLVNAQRMAKALGCTLNDLV